MEYKLRKRETNKKQRVNHSNCVGSSSNLTEGRKYFFHIFAQKLFSHVTTDVCIFGVNFPIFLT
jgi:hypothetical protein